VAARQLHPLDALGGTAQRRVQALMEETEELSLARALGAEPKALETLGLRDGTGRDRGGLVKVTTWWRTTHES